MSGTLITKKINKMKKFALGIDIGGTNFAFGLVDDLGEIHFEESIPTRSMSTPEDMVNEIYNRINQKTSFVNNIVGIGIGAPNGNYFHGTIDNAPNLLWKGIIPLAELFEKKFGVKAVLTNDASAAAVGEQLFGNAKDLKNFVTITLGTGLGSGVIIDNVLIYGHNSLAGEYGHIRVIPDGRDCGCGRKGCLETYASATGVVRSIQLLESPYKSTSGILQIDNPRAENVFELAEKGDVFCGEIIDYTARILGNALAEFACFSNPKAYVLFGGIAQSGEGFAKKVKDIMEEGILNIYQDQIEIRISSLHDRNAAVLGAASLIRKELAQ